MISIAYTLNFCLELLTRAINSNKMPYTTTITTTYRRQRNRDRMMWNGSYAQQTCKHGRYSYRHIFVCGATFQLARNTISPATAEKSKRPILCAELDSNGCFLSNVKTKIRKIRAATTNRNVFHIKWEGGGIDQNDTGDYNGNGRNRDENM